MDITDILSELEEQSMKAFRSKDFQAARQILLKRLQYQPMESWLYANLALAELRSGYLEDAYTHYLQAIEVSPAIVNTTIYDGLVEVCYLLGKTEEQQKIARLSLQHKAEEVKHIQGITLAQPRPQFKRNTPHRNIISFSLFGQQPRYCETAILNVEKAKQLYPAWTCRFYVDYSVPFHVILRLQYLGAEVIYVSDEQKKVSGLFWRFLVMEDPEVDFYLIRDADSLLSYREQAAVEAWLDSDRYFHIMRDGYTHTELIFAGMFAGCGHVFSNLLQQINDFMINGEYLNLRVVDQHFLRHCIWPTFRQSVVIHDSQGYTEGGLNFPQSKHTPPEELRPDFHVGQNHAAEDITIKIHYAPQQRIAWLLIDEQKREVCRYEQNVLSSAQMFSISLPYEYINRLKKGEWQILHYTI